MLPSEKDNLCGYGCLLCIGGTENYKIARAEDDRPVEANRVRKSIGAETSFAQDLSNISQMLQELEQIAQIVEQLLAQL
ncbi:hypothetical protein [Nostoc sp. UIC 10630]|uniref:DinB/UmuC family translesion DNA polymerase n=1 Tax=Nostoc sp. UIC 10630 TaxID=2100146 RepID=UPI0031F5FDAB